MKMSSHSDCFSCIAFSCFFFLASLVMHTLASPTLHYCRDDQRDALLEFRHEFTGSERRKMFAYTGPSVRYSRKNLSSSDDNLPLRYVSLWNSSIDCCSWGGVKCDVNSGEVISLFLQAIPVNNSLKPNSGLFKLQHLQNLTLQGCSLYGEIPSSLGNLSHLTHLDLGYNNLLGQLPDSIGNLTQLRYLDLRENKLSGNIPVSFASLTKLSILDISNNQFTGNIFHNILLNLTSLSTLTINSNQFSSTLPPDMSIFHKLEYFRVAHNSFSGPFPMSLFMIPSLLVIDLSGNQFKGLVKFRNTSSSSKLQWLSVGQNKFYGHIPESVSKISSLTVVNFSDNNFIGPFPRSVLNLVNLTFLDLSYNNFIGPIPRSNLVKPEIVDLSNNRFEGELPFWLGSVGTLKLSHNSLSSFEKPFEKESNVTFSVLEWDLSSNSFRGPLPHWICNRRPQFTLDVSNNGFNGSVPACLRNSLVNLKGLYMHNNNFSGILPPDIFVNATNLVSIDLSDNQLEGQLPRSLVNCNSALRLLNVGNNRIKDNFPSWLGYMLLVLILKSNQFYGFLYHPNVSIGFQTLKVIDISHNAFTGTLPPSYFSNWLNMTTIYQDDADVYFEASLWRLHPFSMEMVNKGVDIDFDRIRTDFKAIDFSRNKLSGKIPDSVGLIKELRLLNLSGNAFTNNIPPSLANLKNLEALDLSQNELSGRIPQELGSLSFLSAMNFSHNNLEGPIPRGTQFERLNCSAFMDNPRLKGLENICRSTHVPDPTPQESEDLSEPKEQVISWIAAAIAYGPGVFCGLVIGHIFASHKHEWLMEKFGLNKWRAPIRSIH